MPRRALREPAKSRGFGGDVGVLQARASVEEHNSVVWFQEAGLHQVIVSDRGGGALRRKKDAFIFRPVLKRSENLLVGKRKRCAAGFAQNFKHDVIAVRL